MANHYTISMNNKKTKMRGFTLVEMLIVIGLIALLATAVLVAINPSRQFKFAHDTEKKAHLATILNAIGQNMAEHQGRFVCNNQQLSLPSATATITSATGAGTFDLAPCIVPHYLSKMPIDPVSSSAQFASISDYHTAYSIIQDTNGHITLIAQSEINPLEPIIVTR